MPSPFQTFRAIGRFASSRMIGARVPLAVYWKVTWRCNLDCEYCGVSERRNPELPTEPLVRLLEDAVEAGVYRVTLSGGEPLMRKDLAVLIHTLASRGISVGLDTNGALVTARIDDLRGIGDATVSLDGDAAIHDAQRGEGSHAAAVAGVESLRRRDIPVTLAGVITATNHARIDAILDVAAALGTTAIVQPATPWLHDTDRRNPIAPTRAEIQDAYQRLLAHPRSDRLTNTHAYIDSFHHWPRMPKLPCPGGRIAAVVNPDGQVGCCDFGVPDDPWRDGVALGFGGAFTALPTPPPCDRCSCATTASVQRAMLLRPRALADLLRRTR